MHPNGFATSSFPGKLPRPSANGKIIGRSLILDPLRGAIVFACLFAVGPSASAQNDPSDADSNSLNRITVQGSLRSTMSYRPRPTSPTYSGSISRSMKFLVRSA